MATFPVKGKPLSNWLQDMFDKPCTKVTKTPKEVKDSKRAK